MRRGDEVPIDISLTGKYEYIQSYGANAVNFLSLYEALDGTLLNGSPSPWLTAGVAPNVGPEIEPWLDCAPYCVALELHNDLRRECPDVVGPPPKYALPIEALLFRYFRAESHAMDVKAGTISISGKCNITAPLAQRVDDLPYLVDDTPSPLNNWPADPRGV